MTDQPKGLSKKKCDALDVELKSAQADKAFNSAISVTGYFSHKVRNGVPLKLKQRRRLQDFLKDLSEYNGVDLSRPARKRVESCKALILMLLTVSRKMEKPFWNQYQKELRQKKEQNNEQQS